MKFINTTGNTVKLTDINLSVPYQDHEPQEISEDDAKKSRDFRKMVMLGEFEIIEAEDSMFGKNIKKMQGSTPRQKNAQNETMSSSINNQMEVKVRGHIFEAGGYAKVNRNLVYGLANQGLRVGYEALSSSFNDLNRNELRKLQSSTVKTGKNAIVIDSMIPTFGNEGFGKYKILYTTIEAGTVPDQFIDIANQYNEVWVTSDFCAEVMKKCGYKKEIFVLPDAVDNQNYTEDVDPYEFNPPLNPFVFVSVFGWSYRKGYDALLKAYLQEFNGDDPVSLLLISRYQAKANKSDFIRDEIDKFIKKYGGDNPPHIARYPKKIPEDVMPKIYKACNAYVLLTRGEGFSLTPCEASLCGLPVISTNISGHTMFLNNNNSTLVNVDEIHRMPQGTMNIHYWDNQEFPKLTSDEFIDDAASALRSVYNNYDEAKEKNQLLSSFLSDNYSVDSIGLAAKSRLEQIWDKIK